MERLGLWDKWGHLCVCVGAFMCGGMCLCVCVSVGESIHVRGCSCVRVLMCVGTHAPMSMYTSLRISPIYIWCLASITLCALFLRQNLSQRPKLMDLPRLTDQWASGTLLCLPLPLEPWICHYTVLVERGSWPFSGRWDPTLGPHAVVSTLPSEPSPPVLNLTFHSV